MFWLVSCPNYTYEVSRSKIHSFRRLGNTQQKGNVILKRIRLVTIHLFISAPSFRPKIDQTNCKPFLTVHISTLMVIFNVCNTAAVNSTFISWSHDGLMLPSTGYVPHVRPKSKCFAFIPFVCVQTSCPQVGSWIGFTVMTQCVPVAFFTLVAFIQMTVWAKGKHGSYLKEFRDYPTLRSSILPFIL